ncbi:MAG: gamma-glutamyltransferase [Planktomarina sp.]
MRDFQAPGRSAIFATNGMCATSHPLAAQAAVKILQDGGNAVDAAIAGAVLLGICEPQMTGIGGDLFALIQRDPNSPVVALNGSGRAPAAADASKLRDRGLATVPLHSADAVTIPGAVDAFCTLATDYGSMSLEQVLAPAIHYAETGVPVAPRVAFDWIESAPALWGKARDLYLKNGLPLIAGEIFAAPNQAKVLRAIAKQGRDGFYTGQIAQDMVSSLNAQGGCHTLADFAGNTCDYHTPIQAEYKGVDMIEHPPNGQGATALLMLNMMKCFDFASMDPWGAERVHMEAEIAKLAYDARNRFLTDPDHMDRIDHMLSQDTANKLAALIDPKRAMASPAALSESVHRDTTYITVVDRNRMAVSLIYSIFHGFGSGIASDEFGILFQNRGAGFTLDQGHPNELAGGKRPMHTIIPGMLANNGRVTMPFGVMGGAYQPHGHARFLSNMVDFGLDAQAAIDAPRSFFDAGQLRLERGYGDATRQALVDMGHNVVTPDGPIGGAQSILMRDDGILQGASDPRKDGCAIGY